MPSAMTPWKWILFVWVENIMITNLSKPHLQLAVDLCCFSVRHNWRTKHRRSTNSQTLTDCIEVTACPWDSWLWDGRQLIDGWSRSREGEHTNDTDNGAATAGTSGRPWSSFPTMTHFIWLFYTALACHVALLWNSAATTPTKKK